MQDIIESQNTIKLDIPVRLQWQSHNGFCGETAVQSCYLYYGSYVSQNMVRVIAESQFLIGESDIAAFDKMGLTFQSWNIKQKKPQYKKYLQWVKTHIKNQSPVIITGYDAQNQNDEYDHIFLAVGVNSDNFQNYSDNDILIYTDHFSPEYVITRFGDIWDTRAMLGNGKSIDFAIPKNLNFGVAITGIKDQRGIFFPIRIYIQENSEPNICIGQKFIKFLALITIRSLSKGVKYVLLRYNRYKNIPSSEVVEEKADKVIRFIAQEDTHTIIDQIISDSCAFYRCVEQQIIQ